MKRLALIIALSLLALIAYNHYHHARVVPTKPVTSQQLKPQVVGSQEVCGSDSPPCIKLVTPEISYDLNDFRLYNRNCISFVSLPDKVQRSYCGPFTLKWEGPGQQWKPNN